MDIKEIENYINKVHWQDAKTYRKTAPHEYTIRHWRKDLEDVFVRFVLFIRENGVPEKWFHRTHIYFYHGEHKYWTMGDPIDQTYVLNRCLIADYPNNVYKGR